jgi:hypothetical protein
LSALRALGEGFDTAVVAAIDARLRAVAAPIGNLIDSVFTPAREVWPSEPWRPETAMVAAADALLRSWLPR